MECSKCQTKLFKIQVIPCCGDCDQNPAWDEDTGHYTTDLKIIDEKELLRSGVENDGECEMGTAHGAGCYLFICSKCNDQTHLPIQWPF